MAIWHLNDAHVGVLYMYYIKCVVPTFRGSLVVEFNSFKKTFPKSYVIFMLQSARTEADVDVCCTIFFVSCSIFYLSMVLYSVQYFLGH